MCGVADPEHRGGGVTQGRCRDLTDYLFVYICMYEMKETQHDAAQT